MSILEKVANIPETLQQNGLFCVWSYQDRPNSTKPAKVPYNPQTGHRARVDHPEDFAPLDVALTALQAGAYSGIGILIDKNLCAIDIDGCIDEMGQLSPLAADVVQKMQTYTEVSPSGRGLRLLFLISEPIDQSIYYVNNPAYHVEVYSSGTNKYVTLTGNVLVPFQHLEGRSPQLQAVLEKYMRRARPAPTPASPGNEIVPPTIPLTQSFDQLAQAIITKASKAKNGVNFTALMNGDTSSYQGDKSAADLALCNILAFWTKKDPSLMDYIFRQSKLYRDKWNRPTGGRTYGELTIQCAIEGTQKVYSGQLIAPLSEKEIYLEREWADMPPDDKSISAGGIIKNLRDYNIAFFPVAPSYYSAHKIGGVHYDVRSSFGDRGKNLKSILESIIVEKSAKDHH